jgi:Arc/MetJ-type ribon-helix-helix transcriptional regulator
MFQNRSWTVMYEEPKMEKITINLPPIEIARMDILIEAGYYPNRTELIRTAIRKTLDTHQEFIAKQIDNFVSSPEREIIDEKISLEGIYAMGVSIIGKETFENAIAEGKRLKIRIVGLLNIRDDVSPEHIEKAVESIKVYGLLRASPKVRKALLRKGGKGV